MLISVDCTASNFRRDRTGEGRRERRKKHNKRDAGLTVGREGAIAASLDYRGMGRFYPGRAAVSPGQHRRRERRRAGAGMSPKPHDSTDRDRDHGPRRGGWYRCRAAGQQAHLSRN